MTVLYHKIKCQLANYSVYIFIQKEIKNVLRKIGIVQSKAKKTIVFLCNNTNTLLIVHIII